MYRKTYVEIDVEKLRHNLNEIKKHLHSRQFFCPMVKSNAYGHGDVPFANFLLRNNVKICGVALIEEALKLRFSGIEDMQILVFGSFDEEGARSIIEHKLTPVIKMWSELEKLEKILTDLSVKDYPVHLKFNTGMNRLGFMPDQAPRLAKYFMDSSMMKLEAISTHFSNGIDYGKPGASCDQQIKVFNQVEASFSDLSPLIKHAYNSSAFEASLSLGEQQKWGVRPGLAMYGIASLGEKSALKLRPAMRLCSELIAVHKVSQGESVSYGARWTAEKDSIIGVVPIGYADGYSYQFSNKGWVTFRGERVPVVGSVCMDYILVDLSKVLPNELGCEGERVIIFGDSERGELSVTEAANLIQTIPYELMTSIGRRVPCEYVGE